MVSRFFVPVITDAPWSKREPRRNAGLWAESEAWKSEPMVGEIVLLVQADRRKDKDAAAKTLYSWMMEPEQLQSWIAQVLAEDGVEVPNSMRAAIAVRMQVRAAMRALFADDQTPRGRLRHKQVGALADAAGSRELVHVPEGDEAAAVAIYVALQRDEALDRVQGKELVYRLDEVADAVLGAPDPARAALMGAVRGGRLATTTQLYAVAAALRTALRVGAAARAADAPTLGSELLAELRSLGVQVTATAADK